MPEFVWKGRTRAGQLRDGVLVGENRDSIAAELRRQFITPTQIRLKKRSAFTLPGLKPATPKELAIFTRQFSVMIDAGLPLVQCIDTLMQQQENKRFRRILGMVKEDVESGSTLGDAMRRHPTVFNDLFCNMVDSGEVGGVLDVILQRLSTFLEKTVKFRRAVRSAMTYPAVVLFIAIVIVIVILWKVIPIFAAIYQSLNLALPFMTEMTITLSNIVGEYILFIVLGMVGVLIGLRAWYQTHGGRVVLDRVTLRIPVIGMLLRKVAIARFSRTLGTLTSSGIAILEGLDITAKTSGNAVIEAAIKETRRQVEEGKTIAEPLRATKVFPPMVTQMLAVGEETGALDTMLSKVADFYEDEVDATVANLVALLEPMLIVFLGAIIGTIIVSMYLPLFELVRQIA